eukprot:CAMPEP_0119268414 /NCGR_PEP_ID=MMETSP1329-20130426/6214_1 /TAXON_ID=114041 /ORGANISM="Genus nov. species nov., Strain RCC1024" /LENGTH=131 /DNA_ID=CAMNT_0007268387 /DNA_START=186 /DNA_END=578 /DNA_ORIENTATION=-
MKKLTALALLSLLAPAAPRAARARPKPPPCPYATLEVDRSASDDEIRAAYRAKALAWHPDKRPAEGRKEAERKFKGINAAYQRIRDGFASASPSARVEGFTGVRVGPLGHAALDARRGVNTGSCPSSTRRP